jgi:hypothetical protein
MQMLTRTAETLTETDGDLLTEDTDRDADADSSRGGAYRTRANLASRASLMNNQRHGASSIAVPECRR